MSENNKNKKEYVQGLWINEKVFQDGGYILKLNILGDRVGDWLKSQAKKDPKGYVRLVIAKSKNPNNENGSHYCYVDNWTPNIKPQESKSQTKPSQSNSEDGKLEEEDI